MLVVKNLPANVRDLGSVPGWGRSPGGGNGNPLQYACLESPHGQRSLVGYSPWGGRESDTSEHTLTQRRKCQDFLGGPVVKTLHCQRRGHDFHPWSGNSDPTCHRAQPKESSEKQKPAPLRRLPRCLSPQPGLLTWPLDSLPL